MYVTGDGQDSVPRFDISLTNGVPFSLMVQPGEYFGLWYLILISFTFFDVMLKNLVPGGILFPSCQVVYVLGLPSMNASEPCPTRPIAG